MVGSVESLGEISAGFIHHPSFCVYMHMIKKKKQIKTKHNKQKATNQEPKPVRCLV